ncbi:MAG TPA: AAA family ATPase [Polyangia bacterium]|nr:AAA family ATPase [Polyangia bacterium]
MDLPFTGTARFQILRALGEGGMGAVYEALDREQNARVALKTLLKLTPDAIGLFKHEFRALQDVRHPNLVSLGELFDVDGSWFFTMELVEGTDFLSWVRPGFDEPPPDRMTSGVWAPRGRLDVERLRAALVQLARGLGALHAAGKVHRDIKPSNIRVTPAGRVALVDFGLVVETDADERSSLQSVVGTAVYMAPEQAHGARVGPAADWYAAGVVLFEALTGRLPFDGAPLQVLLDKQRREPTPPSELADVPDDLDALARALLATDPAARPSGDEVLRRLGASPPEPRTPSTPQLLPFVGRAAELALLAEAFEDVRRHRTVLVALRGESGVGKSALVRHFTDGLRAEVPDLLVLTGRCYEREWVPYKALDGAMEALERHLGKMDPVDAALVVGEEAGLVARLFPVLTRVQAVRRAAAKAPELSNPQELRTRAFAALRALFRRLGERQPQVLIIDDLQWADADSLALLGELLHGPGAPPLLVIVTARHESPALESLGRMLDDVRLVELGGLGPEDSHALARLLSHNLAVGVDPAQIAREAEGHPLFLHELVRHAALVGGPAAVRLEQALLARVDGLEPEARRFLEVLALAGGPLPLKVASAAAELDSAAGARLASVLRVAMLARSPGQRAQDLVEPYHDRVRAAVAGRIGARAGELHARIADALQGTGEHDPHLLVHHLEGSGEPLRAADHATRAAGLAVDALAFDQAAELYSTALRLGQQSVEERRKLHVQLGDALSLAGRPVEAASAYLEVLENADRAARIEYRRRAAEQLLIGGLVERGLAELRVVFGEVGLHLPETPRGALRSLVWNRVKLGLRGMRWKPRDAGDIAPRDLQLLELHNAVATGLSAVDYIRGADFNTRGVLLALKTGQPRQVARSLLLEAALRAAEGARRRPEAARLLGEASRIAEASNDEFLRTHVRGTTGVCDYLTGHFAEAVGNMAAAEQAFRERYGGTVWEVNNLRFFTLLSLRYLGRMTELNERVDRYTREAERRNDRWMQAGLARGMNQIWLLRDDVARARLLQESAWSPPDTGFYHLQHWYALLGRGGLLLYSGERAPYSQLRDGIAVVEKSLLPRIQIVRIEHHWFAGRLAIAEGLADEARRRIRKLRREQVAYGDLWAELLAAGLEPRPESYRRALACAEAAGNLHVLSILRYLLGEPRGAAELAEQGVRDPDKMCRLVIPRLEAA